VNRQRQSAATSTHSFPASRRRQRAQPDDRNEFLGTAVTLELAIGGKLASAKLTGYFETDFLGAGPPQTTAKVIVCVPDAPGWGQAAFENGGR